MFDPRYIVTKAPGVDGPPIPDDEPCLVIRAQDVLAVPMLNKYIGLYVDMLTMQGLTDVQLSAHPVLQDLLIHQTILREWQAKNFVKVADR